MCRAKGTAPNRGNERCETCNDPGIRRDRQNLANRVKREEASIAQEVKTRAPESHTAPEETTLSDTLTQTIVETDGFNDEEVAQVIDDMLADGSAAKNLAENLRSERQSMGNEAWLLNGAENTPENLAKGLATRQQEIMVAGSLIAERAQAIHGIDIEEARQEWSARADELSKAHEKLTAENKAITEAYLDYRGALIEKMDSNLIKYEGDLSDEDKAELEMRKAERVASEKAFKASRDHLALVMEGEDEKTLAVAHKIADANRQAVAEVRAIGNVPVKFSSAVLGGVKENFAKITSETFPDEWVENSNSGSELVIKRITDRDGRAHYADIVNQPYVYSTPLEPDAGDLRFKGWEKKMDKDGNFTGKWHGVKKDLLPEQNAKNANKFKANGTPKGVGWEKGPIMSQDGTFMTAWVRDNPEDKKRADAALISSESSEITISSRHSPHEMRSVIQHEFSHRVEKTNPHIPIMEEAFLASRTTNADGVRDRLMQYRSDGLDLPATSTTKEAIRPDNFVDPYIGKEYHHASREVLSKGTEAVFGGTQGGFVGIGHQRTDHAMRNWILGMYAVA